MLLSLLYVCVFWRGEAEQLERDSAEILGPTARDAGRWVFLFGFGDVVTRLSFKVSFEEKENSDGRV